MVYIFSNIRPSESGLIEIDGEYSLLIVGLSIIIAVIASFTALAMNERAQENSFFHQKFWLILASIAMGFGIWAMHFVGMSAFTLPVDMDHDNVLTFISILPAMIASFIAFYLANRPTRTFWSYMLAGTAMGIGISSMHYIGMFAMQMDITYVYDKLLFVTSIAIAIIVSVIAIYIFSTLQQYMVNRLIQVMTSIVMGLAVSSMHYTGMAAMTFYVPEGFSADVHHHATNIFGLVVAVTIGMAILLGSLLLSSLIDRYVEHRANYYDILTKLPNRRLFEQKLMQSQDSKSLAIWHIHDLERVNREYNYQFGDEVLQQLGVLFRSLIPASTEMYRIEGHRFAFLEKNSDDANTLVDGMKKIAEVLRKPLIVNEKEVLIVAVCAVSKEDDSDETANIYANALAVLNYPSIQYNHEIIQYNPSIHTYSFEQEIARDVTRGIKDDELFLVYQPKVCVNSGKVVGVETLLRWNHSTYGMLSPGVFIPILEENDRMVEVTNWVIEQVCQQISKWNNEKVPFGQVAINIPGQYVTSPRLLKVLKQTLNAYKIVSSQIELEITETSFVENIEEAMRAVSTFRQEGFSVALDDFGTGVSSLSYLKQMPISTLKIDKSFLDGIPQSAKDSSIVQAIIGLGESLDLTIVFEGVEEMEQVDFLVSTCKKPIVQGYYFAKPMKAVEFAKWEFEFSKRSLYIS